MGYRCPGQSGRNLEVELHQCPNCGYAVEIFSDELKVTCPNCRNPVYQETMPSCIDWCPAARECVGPEKWQKLQEEKEELKRLQGAIMGPTEILGQEHRLIEQLLRVLERAAQGLEDGEEVQPEIFTRSLEFIRVIADRCHHGKEEELLFPLLEEHGVPKEGGPLGVLLREHDEGRGFVHRIAERVARYEVGNGEVEEIIKNARGYTQLLMQHIQKEDEALFPMADHLLSSEEQQKLVGRFEEIERERIGEGAHERFAGLILKLERSLGLEKLQISR